VNKANKLKKKTRERKRLSVAQKILMSLEPVPEKETPPKEKDK